MALKDIKILVVDDEAFFRQVLRDMLGKIGFSVVADAANGKDAVEKYRAHRPHVVIMDIYMPEQNGIDATREIMSIDSKANILVCSASDFDYDIQAALDAGAKMNLLKPFVPKEVFEAIKKVLTGK